jgi:hypothetical protein
MPELVAMETGLLLYLGPGVALAATAIVATLVRRRRQKARK